MTTTQSALSASDATSAMSQDFAKVTALYDTGDFDPYELYRKCRETMPIMDGDILAQFNTPSQADFANCGRKVYTLFRYDDIYRVLRDPETFTSSLLMDGLGTFLGDAMLTALDGDDHKRLRTLLQPAFSPNVLKSWVPLIESAIRTNYIEPLRGRRQCDLVADIAMRFPVRVIYAAMGFPDDPASSEQFAGWALRILAGPQRDPVKAAESMRLAFQAAEDLYQHVLPIVTRRRAEGAQGNDLIAHLLRAEANGERLTDQRITNIIRMLLPAAAETTTRSFSSMMVLLLRRPETLARVAADRSLVPRTVNEALRYEPVSAFLARQAARDVTFHGVVVPKGAALSLATCSANRDESVFEDGDTFNIDRPLKPMGAFGMGPHTCLGLQIAKVELESALNAVLDTMPGLRLDPNYPPPIIRGLQLRGPDTVRVVWD